MLEKSGNWVGRNKCKEKAVKGGHLNYVLKKRQIQKEGKVVLHRTDTMQHKKSF